MTADCLAFDRFVLDIHDRRLRRDGAPVDLNARYLDALALLVGDAGKLVAKDRFLEEVWRGVPVTDEALTQCIKTLRRLLGDSAAAPRFIETVPKHGYRFIAPVARIERGASTDSGQPVAEAVAAFGWKPFLALGGAGTVGGGMAGLIGGLIYGFGGASQPLAPGMGAASVMLVLLCITILLAATGGAGVGFGISLSRFLPRRGWPWTVAGGLLGGAIVGGTVKLLGIDAFNLLLGQAPRDITGAGEGALLGGAVGLAYWLGARRPDASLRRSAGVAAAIGAVAGMAIPLLGGRLMGGSLESLARTFPGSRLRLDHLGSLFGEKGFGPISEVVTGGVEGALFSGCVVGALLLARRGLFDTRR